MQLLRFFFPNTDDNRLKLKDVEVFVKDIIKKRAIKKLLMKKEEPLLIYFSGGGEPTYDWSLLKSTVLFIRQQCRENKISLRLSMTTNGVLSKKQIDFISENFTRLMISYDGLPEIQNNNRISPTLDDTNSKVEYSIREFSKRGMPLEIRTIIWQDDYSKIKEMYQHVFSLVPDDGTAVWSIYPILCEGRAVERIKNQEDMSYKNFLNYYFNLAEDIISNNGIEKIKTLNCSIFANDTVSLFCGSLLRDESCLLPDGSIVTCNEANDHTRRAAIKFYIIIVTYYNFPER